MTRPVEEDVMLIWRHNKDHAVFIEDNPEIESAYTPGCSICDELWATRTAGPDAFCLRPIPVTPNRVCTRPKHHLGRHMAVNSKREVVLAWRDQ